MQIVSETISADEAQRRGVFGWPSSDRPISRYSWHYDASETAYIESGSARIETEDGNIEVEAGDMVVLPADLDCTWIIQQPLKKRYMIGNVPVT